MHNFRTSGRIEVNFFLKSHNFLRRLRFWTFKRMKITVNLRQKYSIMTYHLLRSISYDWMMHAQNPLAEKLNTNNIHSSESMSLDKVVFNKLDTQTCNGRKKVITSEGVVYMRKTAGINPQPWANPALSWELAHSSGTAWKSRKKFAKLTFCQKNLQFTLKVVING